MTTDKQPMQIDQQLGWNTGVAFVIVALAIVAYYVTAFYRWLKRWVNRVR